MLNLSQLWIYGFSDDYEKVVAAVWSIECTSDKLEDTCKSKSRQTESGIWISNFEPHRWIYCSRTGCLCARLHKFSMQRWSDWTQILLQVPRRCHHKSSACIMITDYTAHWQFVEVTEIARYGLWGELTGLTSRRRYLALSIMVRAALGPRNAWHLWRE